MLSIDVITLFPEVIEAGTRYSIVGRAIERGLVAIRTVQLRDFATDKHRTVDDEPYGGGAGLVMKPEPIFRAVEFCLQNPAPFGIPHPPNPLLPQGEGETADSPLPMGEGQGVRAHGRDARATVEEGQGVRAHGRDARATVEEGQEGRTTRILLLEPQGKLYTQAMAQELARESHLILICGHYEGVDARVREHLATDTISIGDFVLTGGELPALIIIDSVVRLLPGAIHSPESLSQDSFSDGLLGYPQYTRPEEFRGWRVPPVLLSGNHGAIARWRRREQLRLTRSLRPDLFARAPLTKGDVELLKELNEDEVMKP